MTSEAPPPPIGASGPVSVIADRSRVCLEAAWVIIVASLIFCYGAAATSDDFYIYLRYATNMLAGSGPVYNSGEPSSGVTSLAWLGMMSSVAKFFGNVEVLWKLAAVVLVALGLAALVHHFRPLNLTSALGVSLFPILDPFAIRWYATGMENGLVLLAAVLLFVQLDNLVKRPTLPNVVVLCATAAVLPLVRPELIILTIVTVLYVGTRGNIAYASTAGVAIVVFVCMEAAIHRWTGFWWPQTGKAKALLLSQNDVLYAPTALMRIAALAISGGLVELLAAGLGRRVRTISLPFTAALLLATGIFAYFAITHTLVSTRYSVVFSAPLLCVAALAIGHRIQEQRRWDAEARTALATQALACFAGLIWMWPATQTNEAADIRPIGEWAKSHLPSGARVALTEIGAFGYYYEGPIIDLVGLVSPAVVTYVQYHGRPSTIAQLEPLLINTGADYYVDTFGSPLPLVGQQLVFTAMHEWRVTRNNLSGGHELRPDIWRLYSIARRAQ